MVKIYNTLHQLDKIMLDYPQSMLLAASKYLHKGMRIVIFQSLSELLPHDHPYLNSGSLEKLQQKVRNYRYISQIVDKGDSIFDTWDQADQDLEEVIGNNFLLRYALKHSHLEIPAKIYLFSALSGIDLLNQQYCELKNKGTTIAAINAGMKQYDSQPSEQRKALLVATLSKIMPRWSTLILDSMQEVFASIRCRAICFNNILMTNAANNRLPDSLNDLVLLPALIIQSALGLMCISRNFLLIAIGAAVDTANVALTKIATKGVDLSTKCRTAAALIPCAMNAISKAMSSVLGAPLKILAQTSVFSALKYHPWIHETSAASDPATRFKRALDHSKPFHNFILPMLVGPFQLVQLAGIGAALNPLLAVPVNLGWHLIKAATVRPDYLKKCANDLYFSNIVHNGCLNLPLNDPSIAF